jgi:glycosyltransferase involved in cell wall biosynthesis
MATRAEVLAIIPALNEEESLPGVLADLQYHHPEIDVLVIDDGSSDDTAPVAAMHGAHVAQLPFNMGIGAALRTGFRYAARHGYTAAFQFDADGQHEARTVGALLAPLSRGADLVIGTRFGHDGEVRYEVGVVRGLAMAVLRWILGVMVGRRLTDTSSGLRAFSSRMVREFSTTYPREYMDSVEAIVIAARSGMTIVEVPVTMSQRSAGQPSNRSFKLAYNYLRLLLVLASSVPLRRGTRRPLET